MGTLTHIADYTAGSSPYGVAADPTGAFLLVTNEGSNNVSAFAIDSSAGTLSAVPGSPFPAGRAPENVTFTPDGKFAYVTNYGANDISSAPFFSSYSVNGSTGVLTPIPGSDPGGANPTAVAPSGTHLFVSSGFVDGLFCDSINPVSGVLTSPCPFPYPPPGSPFEVVDATYAFDPSGHFLYVASFRALGVLQLSGAPVAVPLVQTVSRGGGSIAVAPVH